MTSPQTDVSEAEVEAGARVMAELCTSGIIYPPQLSWHCWMGSARSIITAAAQVRAQGDEAARLRLGIQNFIDGDWGPKFATKHDKCPHGRFGWEDCGNCADEYFHALLYPLARPAKPGLMPIYGATEDQGPDILGERKGG